MVCDQGFTVVPGPFMGRALRCALAAGAAAIARAGADETHNGSTSVRTGGLLQRAPMLADIFTHEPLLKTAAAIIGGPFKLSAFHARSVLPGAAAQRLHQDAAPGEDGWPLMGFIFMIDAFRIDNGATRFLRSFPGQAGGVSDEMLIHADEIHACGEAGSMIIFDGSVWHGHGANRTKIWRRSVQGAFIPADATAAIDHRSQLSSAAWSALPETAQAVICGFAV